MTNQEILTKAIEKAIAGGWNIETVGAFSDWEIDDNGLYDDRDYYVKERVTPKEIIYNHDFAKSLWGEYLVAIRNIEADELISLNTTDRVTDDFMPAYKFHLQQMVLADDPIQYLGENL